MQRVKCRVRSVKCKVRSLKLSKHSGALTAPISLRVFEPLVWATGTFDLCVSSFTNCHANLLCSTCTPETLTCHELHRSGVTEISHPTLAMLRFSSNCHTTCVWLITKPSVLNSIAVSGEKIAMATLTAVLFVRLECGAVHQDSCIDCAPRVDHQAMSCRDSISSIAFEYCSTSSQFCVFTASSRRLCKEARAFLSLT